jgi:hypothetical protein
MTTDSGEPNPDEFPLVRGGLSHRLAQRFGLGRSGARHWILTVALLLLLTWVPPALLSVNSGYALEAGTGTGFFHDPNVHTRFWFVLPLLELAQGIVAISLTVQVRHLLKTGIVPERERARYRSAQDRTLALRGAGLSEALLLAAALVISAVARLYFDCSAGDPSWERTGGARTPAGWWYLLVSLPILYFFLLRWAWVFLMWCWFLFRTSLLDLELTPAHPDRAGGLGFIGWGTSSFASVTVAVSAMMSAALAHEHLNRGSPLEDLKYQIIVFVVLTLAIFHAPLLAFARKLTRGRYAGLLEFGGLVWRYDRAFDEKWIRRPGSEHDNSLLGSADVQSLADIATSYENIYRMRPIPFDTKAFTMLVLAALLPLLPFLATTIPSREIFLKLVSLLV